jgi:hypothetical protein
MREVDKVVPMLYCRDIAELINRYRPDFAREATWTQNNFEYVLEDIRYWGSLSEHHGIRQAKFWIDDAVLYSKEKRELFDEIRNRILWRCSFCDSDRQLNEVELSNRWRSMYVFRSYGAEDDICIYCDELVMGSL